MVMSHKCQNTVMSEITCWALLREAKVEHELCLNVNHCGYLSAITYSMWFKVTQVSTLVLKWQSLYRKMRFFFALFFFFENLLLMHHINKLIHRDLTRDLSKACCIGLPSTIVRLFIHEINASHIELLSIGLCVFSKQRVCLLFHTCAYRDQTFNSTMTLYLF